MTRRLFGPSAPGAKERSFEVKVFGHNLEVLVKPLLPVGAPKDSERNVVLANGLVDTGATDVCIDYRLADILGLPEIDVKDVGIPGSSVKASVRMGVLDVPALSFSEPMPLYAFKMRHSTHEIILGRSFLCKYIVTFHGPQGIMTFTDPAPNYKSITLKTRPISWVAIIDTERRAASSDFSRNNEFSSRRARRRAGRVRRPGSRCRSVPCPRRTSRRARPSSPRTSTAGTLTNS